MTARRVDGSFRDPGGFLFRRDGTLYRQVNASARNDFEALSSSGLYQDLTERGLLVPHRQVDLSLADDPEAIAVIAPEPIAFVSYPYEWCFGQLRDAALLTLEAQLRALERGMVLRDASAYNVQFRDAHPVFIDTLSFGRYVEGEPWVAYRQFCEHFLAPLALMSATDVRCAQLLRHYLDGIPLDLASALLPTRSWMRPGFLIHIHLHARAQRRYADVGATGAAPRRATLAKPALKRLIEHLRSTIAGMSWRAGGTAWADYTEHTNYNAAAIESKRRIVSEMLAPLAPRTVWDLGANTGLFSRVAREHAETVIAFDIDPAAVERNHRAARDSSERGILPLLLDLTNPSPAHGWAHTERMSLEERGPADAVLALALVHHLAISNNVPLDRVAAYLARLGRSLIIEFVPKSDSQVKRLLATRADIFPDYTREGFERAFAASFELLDARDVQDSERRIYLMRARAAAIAQA